MKLHLTRWDGQAIHEAQNDKRRRYHELVHGGRCHLLVMAFEVGWLSHKGVTFLRKGPTLANPVLALLIWPILVNPCLAILVFARPILIFFLTTRK